MAQILPKTAESQVSFKNGTRENVAYGTKGSVRPDFVVGKRSIEVKNYDIHNNREGLIQIIAKQAEQRKVHLPENMRQTVQIDLRGQRYTGADIRDIKTKIEQKTKGIIKADDVEFITDKKLGE